MNILPHRILASLNTLEQLHSHISLRYIISAIEYKEGRASLICDALSYGVGQITYSHGTKIIPCQRMLPSSKTLSYIINEGAVNKDWHYVDVSISDSVIDFNSLGFASLLSLIAGDIFGSPYFRNSLVLYDMKLSNTLESMFPGPQFGSYDIIDKFNSSANKNVLLGLLLKPDVGVSKEYYADIAEAAAQGGIDYIKEDELTLDSKICPRFKRIEEISNRLIKTKKNILYAANITSPPYLIEDNSIKAIEHGATALLLNGIQVGLDMVSYLARNNQIKVPIHFHRAGYDLLSTGHKAISVSLLTRLFRLAGADIIHVGSPLGNLFDEESIKGNITQLLCPIGSIKTSLPVFSRSSSESLDLIANTNKYNIPSLVLFDSEIYTSPKGIEKAVKDIRRIIK